MSKAVEHFLLCPSCGAPMLLKTGAYRDRTGKAKNFYRCACGVTHGAHPDGRPLGNPTADPAVKLARHEAHRHLDELWEDPAWRMSRDTAYDVARRLMNLTPDQCHIGLFDLSRCNELIDKLKLFKEGRKNGKAKTQN